MTRLHILILALTVTGTAVLMAIISAMGRATGFDQALLITISVVIVLLAHLIPALPNRSIFSLGVWAFCILITVYGHASFYVSMTHRYADAKVAESPEMVTLNLRITDLGNEINSIVARPITVVTKELSITTNYRARSALRSEVSEANRLITLQQQRDTLKNEVVTMTVTEGNDGLVTSISNEFGVTRQSVILAMGLVMSFLIEAAGVLLWCEYFRLKPTAQPVKKMIAEKITRPVDEPIKPLAQAQNDEAASEPERKEIDPDEVTVKEILKAISEDKCKATVASVRNFLGCRMDRAMELTRKVKAG